MPDRNWVDSQYRCEGCQQDIEAGALIIGVEPERLHLCLSSAWDLCPECDAAPTEAQRDAMAAEIRRRIDE